MFYSVHLDKIKKITLVSTVTKQPTKRIFPIDKNSLEIHLCCVEPLTQDYVCLLFFPNSPMPPLSIQTPVKTLVLCAEVEADFCETISTTSPFCLFGNQSFLLPSVFSVPSQSALELQHLFLKLQNDSEQKETLFFVLRKMNRLCWNQIISGGISSSYVLCALDYILTHYKEKITIQTIADSVLVTPNYLSRLFQEKTGKTVKEVLDIARASAAREDLFYSEKSIPKVAISNGFSTGNSMRKIFLRFFQMSPEECQILDRKNRRSPLPFEACLLELLLMDCSK